MKSLWSEKNAREFVARHADADGEQVALRAYSSRLLGAEPALVLHGGGNTSLKGSHSDLTGEVRRAIWIKPSGADLATIDPSGFALLDLASLERLKPLPGLADEEMFRLLQSRSLRHPAPLPSIETLAHAFLPQRFIDHTHADAILALTNRANGDRIAAEALGDEVIVMPFVPPGFELAAAAARAIEGHPSARAMVWRHHGLVTWGESAREAYESTIELVGRAERHLARLSRRPASSSGGAHTARPTRTASREPSGRRETRQIVRARAAMVAPLVRGLLARASGMADRPYRRVILATLTDSETIDFLASNGAKPLALAAPLTTDHLVRVKTRPLWIDSPVYEDPRRLREQIARAVQQYVASYGAYLARHAAGMPRGAQLADPYPRAVLMPGLGAMCAGDDARSASIARDILAHTLRVKRQIAGAGCYEGLPESVLFAMEHRVSQQAKVARRHEGLLGGEVALVTGAAGAIGAGVCIELLDQGVHLVVTDLPGEPLDRFVSELRPRFGERVMAAPLDVTDPDSVRSAFDSAIRSWGGIDLLVINAGSAHVSKLADMPTDAFRRLERVNVEGTVHLLREAARLFERQGTGGDIVLVSSKNVFAPGAGFGAYSATKAAAHQLARVASLELAPLDVRVNMVAPDAVFGEANRPSGLWEEVGPARMRARGLDAKGLEAYYRERSLLKVRITPQHVARAVIFFATRQAPVTGVTLPVDGGLPEATPR